CRCLQRVARTFLPHVAVSHAVQLPVENRCQLLQRLFVAVMPTLKQPCDFLACGHVSVSPAGFYTALSPERNFARCNWPVRTCPLSAPVHAFAGKATSRTHGGSSYEPMHSTGRVV